MQTDSDQKKSWRILSVKDINYVDLSTISTIFHSREKKTVRKNLNLIQQNKHMKQHPFVHYIPDGWIKKRLHINSFLQLQGSVAKGLKPTQRFLIVIVL